MSMIPRNPARVFLATAFALALVSSANADTDSPDAKAKPLRPKENRRAIVEVRKSESGLTAEQQQQALGFARSQHPELADLLEKLKEANPKEYSNALLELYRAEQKLHRMADQNPQRYAIELRLWKVGSRIRLHMAQLVMEGEGAPDENLQEMLSERRNLKIELLQFDRAKTVERLTNLDRQLEQFQRDPEGDLAIELAKLKQTAGKQARVEKMKRNAAKAGGKPGAGQKPKKQAGDKSDSGAKSDAGKDE